jgi:hypothetical protein
MNNRIRHFVVVCGFLLGLSGIVVSQEKKQTLDAGPGQRPFDVTRHSVPIEDIRGGGLPKDGIPSLDRPRFVTAREADRFLNSGDRVLAIEQNGVAKAYPIRILNWHDIVNDEVGGQPVAVTW